MQDQVNINKDQVYKDQVYKDQVYKDQVYKDKMKEVYKEKLEDKFKPMISLSNILISGEHTFLLDTDSGDNTSIKEIDFLIFGDCDPLKKLDKILRRVSYRSIFKVGNTIKLICPKAVIHISLYHYKDISEALCSRSCSIHQIGYNKEALYTTYMYNISIAHNINYTFYQGDKARKNYINLPSPYGLVKEDNYNYRTSLSKKGLTGIEFLTYNERDFYEEYKPEWSIDEHVHHFYRDKLNLIGVLMMHNGVPIELIKIVFAFMTKIEYYSQ